MYRAHIFRSCNVSGHVWLCHFNINHSVTACFLLLLFIFLWIFVYIAIAPKSVETSLLLSATLLQRNQLIILVEFSLFDTVVPKCLYINTWETKTALARTLWLDRNLFVVVRYLSSMIVLCWRLYQTYHISIRKKPAAYLHCTPSSQNKVAI